MNEPTEKFVNREEARAAKRHIQNMIFAGLIAAKEWQIDPLTVRVMQVPFEAGRQIIVQGKEPIEDNYIMVQYPEEIITLREWRTDGEVSIFLAYSKICNVLVVRTNTS